MKGLLERKIGRKRKKPNLQPYITIIIIQIKTVNTKCCAFITYCYANNDSLPSAVEIILLKSDKSVWQ